MPKIQRPHTLSIKLSRLELDQAHALADASDCAIGVVMRRFIAREYELRFGDAKPAHAVLKPGPKKSEH
jgi:hypothetical protein